MAVDMQYRRDRYGASLETDKLHLGLECHSKLSLYFRLDIQDKLAGVFGSGPPIFVQEEIGVLG